MAPRIKLAAGGLAPDTNAQCPREKDVRSDVGPVTNPGLGSDEEGTIKRKSTLRILRIISFRRNSTSPFILIWDFRFLLDTLFFSGEELGILLT